MSSQDSAAEGPIGHGPILYVDLGPSEPEDPRKASCLTMLKDGCCPFFKILSITTALMLVFLVLFIIPLALGGLDKSMSLLEANSTALINIGANEPIRVREG